MADHTCQVVQISCSQYSNHNDCIDKITGLVENHMVLFVFLRYNVYKFIAFVLLASKFADQHAYQSLLRFALVCTLAIYLSAMPQNAMLQKDQQKIARKVVALGVFSVKIHLGMTTQKSNEMKKTYNDAHIYKHTYNAR